MPTKTDAPNQDRRPAASRRRVQRSGCAGGDPRDDWAAGTSCLVLDGGALTYGVRRRKILVPPSTRLTQSELVKGGGA